MGGRGKVQMYVSLVLSSFFSSENLNCSLRMTKVATIDWILEFFFPRYSHFVDVSAYLICHDSLITGAMNSHDE